MRTAFFFRCFLACVFTLVVSAVRAAAPARPNIVLIISDDQAWNDYGFMGGNHVRTPHLDRLASGGLTFKRGYVTTALCSPSLASILTGRHPHEHGITGNDPVKSASREDWLDRFFQYPLLPKELANAGYATLHTGKYWMRKPADAGFTQDMGDTDRHGGKALAIGRQTMQPIFDFVDESTKNQKPFFVWYAPMMPHTPHTPPPRLAEKYADRKNGKYLAMVEWFDETCGALMEHLRTRGVDRNTLVLLITDNGWNEFGKCTPYENGVRTPIVIHWPDKVSPRSETRHLAQNIDVFPTLLSAAGVAVPKGVSGIDLLDEKAVAAREALFFSNYAHDMISAAEPEKSLWTRSCIHGNWKLVSWRKNPPEIKPSLGGDRHKNPGVMQELFDLEADPGETLDLAERHPERVRELQARMNAWWNPDQESVK
jgi:arylsulfatase A-like enzyme